ncbi:hypothetical protein [Streptomyces sp. JV178]|uniref:hypothetical protein n=1 Tax=Streptomyces sp. JV178 TaxID=858632 RepID=UPI00117D7728|nr:hypothetical protein [Streptomyces sp. JV178]
MHASIRRVPKRPWPVLRQRPCKTSSFSRAVRDYWRRWAQEDDKVRTGGMMTGGKCGWTVVETQANIDYDSDATAKNMVVARKTSGSCTVKGDSGGPVYTVNSSDAATAKGIISGGGGGATKAAGGWTRAGLSSPTWDWPTALSPAP